VEISIPNSSFISSPIVNFSLKDPYVRLKIPVGVAYSSDPKEVKRLLEEVIEELPYTVRFLPKMVRFEELGDSALIFRAIFWIDVRKDMWVRNIISDFYFRAWYKLKEAGVEIPFPQNDVWFRNSLKVEIERPNLPKEES
jgi:small-conductance mechanosensitive channel